MKTNVETLDENVPQRVQSQPSSRTEDGFEFFHLYLKCLKVQSQSNRSDASDILEQKLFFL